MEMLRARGSQNGVVQVTNLSANNLLQKFIITSSHFCHREEAKKKEEEEEEEKDHEIELTLGLSLNGQFGTDPRSRKRKNFELGRSSSIPEGFTFKFNEQRSGGDMEQTVKRGVSDMFQLDRTRSLPVVTRAGPDGKPEKQGLQADTKKKRSEKKTRTFMDFKVPIPVNGKGKTVNTTTEEEKKKVEISGMEKARNILEDMPCVSTRDVGADGKRTEGFLYWYGGNKEEVKIVCVCHGSFLSPAEFVRHGGGTVDVTINPLRHIVVKVPSSSSSSL